MKPGKDEQFKPWKVRGLKVYSSTEWLADGKKKYRQVFERASTAFIYSEFSFFNKLFDEKDWTANVTLKVHLLNEAGEKVKQICEIPATREVKMSENIVFLREGWGNPKKGMFWKKGRYLWEAYLDDKRAATELFFVEQAGPVGPAYNPYFKLKGLRLYEGVNQHVEFADRTYHTTFDHKKTRYVWGELRFENLRQDKEWWCEVIFNFYNDARELKGRTQEVVRVPPGVKEVPISSGWGSEKQKTWHKDHYSLEVVFMEQLIAVAPFEVGDAFVEGEPAVVGPVGGQQGSGLPVSAVEQEAEKKVEEEERSLEELLETLDALIGLESVKTRIREYIQYLKFLKIREEKGFEEAQQIQLHAVFTGNPGTGKTTVARQLGKLYQKMGLLSKGHVHEVDRADLVGEFIGQTAPKVRKAIKDARGGILFIDEAYALFRSKEDAKDFGREVIEILIKEMSDGEGDLAVLVAGYPEEMQTFLDSNPGLKSRFTMQFEFPDYLPQELMDIAGYAMNASKISVTDQARDFLYEKLVEAYRGRDRSFGNARYVHALINESKMNMGLRVMQVEDLESLSDEDLSTVHIEDLEKIFGKAERRVADIPVDEVLLQGSMAELNALIGLDTVKNEIHELVKLVKFYRETGRDVLHTFSLHTVFTGNPGTGKTTVARILANIYKALGILERGHLVEVDREKLVGGFVGQTALKSTAQLDAAHGGVLFVDEAYALTQGGANDYGKEAVDTILKRMEDQRGQFVLIAAGYPENMRRFLESNPGLKSRFDKVIHFEDYGEAELYEICRHMLQAEPIIPDSEAEAHLKAYFSSLLASKDQYFGNARTVRKVVEEAVRKQHLRLAMMDKDARTQEMLETLTLEDVQDFKEEEGGGGKPRIGFGRD